MLHVWVCMMLLSKQLWIVNRITYFVHSQRWRFWSIVWKLCVVKHVISYISIVAPFPLRADIYISTNFECLPACMFLWVSLPCLGKHVKLPVQLVIIYIWVQSLFMIRKLSASNKTLSIARYGKRDLGTAEDVIG